MGGNSQGFDRVVLSLEGWDNGCVLGLPPTGPVQ